MIKISGVLQKKSLKMSKNKKRRINTQRQVTNKVMKKPIVKRYKLKIEEPCIFCLKKRQQSSPSVMFARLKSNKQYKPSN